MTADRTTTAPLAAYDRDTIALRWLTAALVACGWLLAQLIDDFPTGTPGTLARSVNVSRASRFARALRLVFIRVE